MINDFREEELLYVMAWGISLSCHISIHLRYLTYLSVILGLFSPPILSKVYLCISMSWISSVYPLPKKILGFVYSSMDVLSKIGIVFTLEGYK